jgi:sulfopyruvate decarboxylase TPP-binding subunit
LAGLVGGKFQADVLTPPTWTMAAKQGYREIFDLASLDFPFPVISVVSTRRFIDANPEVILNILRATSEAILLYKTRPELTVPVVAKYMRVAKDDPALVEAQRSVGQLLNQNLPPSLEGIRFVLDYYAERQPSLKNKNPANSSICGSCASSTKRASSKICQQIERINMRAADALVDILKTEGVKFVATLPGDDILPIFDVLHENGDVRLILTRHEQATVYIADGYARSTGEVGVAMVTKGPGRCNAFTAIVNAFTDCVPLVVIFGHSSRTQLAKGMLQEVPYLDTFQTMAKWTFSVPSAERIPEVFRRAFTLARSGRPGPVIIEVPQDISMAQAEMPTYHKTRRVRFGPDPDDVDKLIELLLGAKRPLIYAGRGALWSRATEDLVRVAEAYAIPVMATLPAKGAMPEDHPLCLGLGGYPRAVYSTGQSRKFAEEADLVIALGCSFRQHATSSWLPKPADAKLVQVDIDAPSCTRIIRPIWWYSRIFNCSCVHCLRREKKDSPATAKAWRWMSLRKSKNSRTSGWSRGIHG